MWLVDSVESMMVHGLANPKFNLWNSEVHILPLNDYL